MKKKVIIAAIAIVCIAVAVVGLIVIKNIIGRTWDLEIPIEGSTEKFVFEKICASEPENNMGYKAYTAELSDPDGFYDDCVKDNPYYLYSVNADNERVEEETGDYLFFKDNNYFLVSVRDGRIYGTELSQSFWFNDTGASTWFSCPFIQDEKHIYGGYGDLDKDKVTVFSWTDAPGINSFDELTEYYSKIKDVDCEINAEQKTVTLPVWSYNSSYEQVAGKDKVQIKETDGKIEVTYIEG